jgi:hypothetical protein
MINIVKKWSVKYEYKASWNLQNKKMLFILFTLLIKMYCDCDIRL